LYPLLSTALLPFQKNGHPVGLHDVRALKRIIKRIDVIIKGIIPEGRDGMVVVGVCQSF
jgi:hypothetical protein